MNRKPTPSILDDVLSATPTTVKLSIEQIKIDGGTQMRAGLHEPTVLEYLEAMQPVGWSQFPPIVVYHDGSDYWLADGFHRLEAYRRAAAQVDQPADRIPADVRAGTRRDAILYAAGANAQHGLRRTNADKRRAVETLLRDEEWRQWSDREIARRCEVDNSFVSRVRRELSVDKPQIAERTVQRNGTTYTQNTANIGATRTYASGLPTLDVPLQPGSPEAKRLAKEIKAATWADRRGPVVEKGRGGERKTTQTASALTVDGDLTAADVQVLQPMPPTEPEMVPLAAVSRLGHVIGTALGAAATSPTVEAGIARARELLVTPTPPADDRRTRLNQYATQFEATLEALRDWAQLTGRFTLTSEAERGLHRVLEATRSELAALNGQPHQVWGEETTI